MTARVILTALLSLGFAHTSRSALAADADQDALTAVIHDLCSRDIAMLGESATHGDGQTETFKVALVERLVNECGYDSVYFEANHAEFLHIAQRLRAGQPVSANDLSAAIGGLWRFDQEFQPLVSFLLAKAQSGQIALGGIDDQLGQFGQDYANGAMVAEWTDFLPRQQRSDCMLALHHRIYSDYTQAAPYSKSDRSQIATCLSDIHLAVAADKTTGMNSREEREEMIAATQRWISRDFLSPQEQVVSRDQSMFQNFEWLRRQQSSRHKAILWAATLHIAKQADPTWGDRTGTNFGSDLHQKYGARVFSLGFSAFGGSYRQGGRDVHEIPTPPPDSLESQAFRGNGSDAVYVDSARIAAIGAVPGAIFRHIYQSLQWREFLDGIVVFRQEKPPTSTR